MAGVSADEQEDAVRAWLGSVWALRWDNHRKEAVFRLALDAVPAVRFQQLTGASCACGAVGQGRAPAFWDCPVAAAVVAAVRSQLPQGTILRREHFWLGRPPAAGRLDRGVWEVVVVAAVAAMLSGLKLLSAWAHASAAGGGGRELASAPAASHGPAGGGRGASSSCSLLGLPAGLCCDAAGPKAVGRGAAAVPPLSAAPGGGPGRPRNQQAIAQNFAALGLAGKRAQGEGGQAGGALLLGAYWGRACSLHTSAPSSRSPRAA